MKKIFVITQIIIIGCISNGCVLLHLRPEPGRRYYQGYIYTLEGQPIQGLRVIAVDSSGGITDKRGYFKFKQTCWSGDLAVILPDESEEKTIDFIDLCRFGRRRLHWKPFPWQKDPLNGCFDEREADTFFVDMDCKWKSNRVLQGQKRATKRVLRKSVALANCLPNAAEPSFGTFTDERDGKTYKTVTINGQTWMAQNLNFEPPSDISGCYEDKNCNQYGRLYDWKTAKRVCPDGWKLPNDEDWEKLVETACGKEFAGSTLKSKRRWNETDKGENGNGTDNFGFSALPGGKRYPISNCGCENNDIGTFGYWWIAKPTDSLGYMGYKSGYLRMNNYDDGISVYSDNRDLNWYSVRCIADGSSIPSE
ncbi:MAG: hypothetical protein LBC59_07800 [Chitinispirillales bacterium]|nr:hypothetical protein [Chitinispirillales bacterium]